MDAERNNELYRALLGDKADYYVPLFERFDNGGSRASWNWPAFFVAFYWMLYRRMYGYAAAYFFLWPLALVVIMVLTQLLLGPAAAAIVYFLSVVAVPFVIMPMFASALFHNHAKDRIARVVAESPSHEAAVQRLIGQRSTSGGVAIVVTVFAGVFIIGILAAIAIPAYQDYTIRAQVTEGLMMAAPVKDAVARSYADGGSMPADLEALQLDGDAPQGRYVEALEVFDGKIAIRYGAAANQLIQGRVLVLAPEPAADGSINWICGYASPEAGEITDVEPKHLPSACRSPKRG